MKTDSNKEKHTLMLLYGVIFFIILPYLLVASCNAVGAYNDKKSLEEQEEEYSHHRNLIECYQNGVLYKTYLVGHVYDNTTYQYYKKGKRRYRNAISSNRISATVIGTNENINIGLENCTVTELPDV